MLRAVLEGWKRARFVAYRGGGIIRFAQRRANSRSPRSDTGFMENLLRWQPDIILVQEAVTADFIRRDPLWQGVKAVAEQRILFLSGLPFGWLDAPPGINRLLGLRRLHAWLIPPSIASLKVTCRITPNCSGIAH